MARELRVAYAAGVIDSDGTIGIFKKFSKVGGHSEYYQVRVGVRQVDPEAIDLLHELFGGYRSDGVKSYSKNGKPFFDWRVTGRVATRCLGELLPHFRIKVDRAVNAIEAGRLNTVPKARVPLEVDTSEGMVSLIEASRIIGKSPQSLAGAVSRGVLPGTGRHKTRLIPLATARVWAMRSAGGPVRSLEVTAEMERCYLESKRLNRVGL